MNFTTFLMTFLPREVSLFGENTAKLANVVKSGRIREKTAKMANFSRFLRLFGPGRVN